MKENTCLLCGKRAKQVHDSYPGYQRPETFQIYSCQHCNTNFPVPQKNATELYDLIYSHRDNHPGYERYWRYRREVKHTLDPLRYLAEKEAPYFAIREFLTTKSIPKSAKIIEVGSGLGYLTYAMREAGFHAHGIEISKIAVEEAKKSFGDYYLCDDLFAFTESNKHCYDVVVSTEVIEHVERPLNFIKTMLSLLKPGGYLVLTTPNRSFFPSQMVWESSLPPVHLWWFSEQSMKFVGRFLGVGVEFNSFKNYFAGKNVAWSVRHCKKIIPESILDTNGEILPVSDEFSFEAEDSRRVFRCSFRDFAKRVLGRFPGSSFLWQKAQKLIGLRIEAATRCNYMCVVFRA